jgi:hypothetical protein
LRYSTLGDFGTFDILIVGLILFGSPALSLFILVEISGHEVLRWVQKMCVKMVHQLTVGHFPEKKKLTVGHVYGADCSETFRAHWLYYIQKIKRGTD